MSDHAWTREHAAAFVVGGLSAEEAERLEGHTRDCPECAAVVADARRLDGDLRDLFADDRPSPGLEDRAVRLTRDVRRRRRQLRISGRMARFVVAAGVLVALGSVGAFLGDRLPLPGEDSTRTSAANHLKEIELAARSATPREYGSKLGGEWGESDNYGVASYAANGQTFPNKRESTRDEYQNFYGYTPQLWSDVNGVTAGKDETFKLGTVTSPTGRVKADDNVEHKPYIQNGGANPEGLKYKNEREGERGDSNNVFFSTLPDRGTPIQQRPTSNTFTIGGTMFGAYPQPAQNMPVAPTLPKGFAQGQTPDFKGQTHQGMTGLAFHPGEHRPALSAGDPKDPTLMGRTESVPALQTGVEKPPPASTEDRPNPNDPKPPLAGEGEPAAARRVIIRSGEMDFEVDSFDASAAIVTRLVGNTKGAFVATVNSDKLANGKVKGSITVRTPPEHLDALVADLRRDLKGDLKGLKIGSQDITKQYTDLESRLRAARTMEQRLLQIIKDGKGEIKDLIAAERELGVWRTKIEEIEGELRYYANLVGLSTLTISLTEKEIRAAAAVTENEKVQAGVEVEDVDKAYQQALAAVAEAKGRVAKSELKQLAAGQFNANLQFEVPPDAAGPMRDRLRQLGRVARLEIDRSRSPVDGTTPADAKVKRGDTTFAVQLYNLANIQPRETVQLGVAAVDVRAAFQALRDAAAKSAGRVKVAQLAEQDAQNVSAQFEVEIRRADEGPLQAALAAAGEVLGRQVTRAPEGDEYTDTKIRYLVTLLSAARMSPRETATLTVEVADVSQSAAVLATQVADAGGRQVSSESSTEQNGKATAKLTYEVPLSAAGLADKFKSLGTVRNYQTNKNPQAPSGKLAKARIEVTLVSGDEGIWPRVHRGLSHSATVLLTSLTWVVVGLCVVLPFGVVGYGGYQIVRRLVRPKGNAPAAG
jgi:hypothetical protein